MTYHHASGPALGLGFPSERAPQGVPDPAQGLGPNSLWDRVRPAQGGKGDFDAVTLAAGPKEIVQGGTYTQDLLGPAWLIDNVGQRRPDVVPFVVDSVEPGGLLPFEQSGLRSLGQLKVELGVGGI